MATAVESAQDHSTTTAITETVAVPVPQQLHKLSTVWSLWVMSQHGKLNKDHWQANQTKAVDVSTVEDFWRMYNHIHPPSKIASADYSLFRQGITPAWEDKICQKGGRWVAKSDKVRGVDEAWLNVLLAMIGEQFSKVSNSVCGAVVSTRRSGVKLAIWVATRDKDEILGLGKLFKEMVQPLFQGREEGSYMINFDFFGEPNPEGRPIEL
jgi:translation initiation factor 4E